MNIYISPSNQRANVYAGNISNEEISMEETAKIVAEYLNRFDVNVKVAPLDMFYGDRPADAARWGAHLYLALHTNAEGAPVKGTAAGAVAFCNNTRTEDLARRMVSALDSIAPVPSNRRADSKVTYRIEDLAEVRLPNRAGMDVCFVEINFHTNPIIAAWLLSERREIAKVIAMQIVFEYDLKSKNITSIIYYKQGYTGPEIIQLQRDLSELGFPLDDDGSFGPLTKDAVIAFQTKFKLTIDGIAGPETLGRIVKELELLRNPPLGENEFWFILIATKDKPTADKMAASLKEIGLETMVVRDTI